MFESSVCFSHCDHVTVNTIHCVCSYKQELFGAKDCICIDSLNVSCGTIYRDKGNQIIYSTEEFCCM